MYTRYILIRFFENGIRTLLLIGLHDQTCHNIQSQSTINFLYRDMLPDSIALASSHADCTLCNVICSKDLILYFKALQNYLNTKTIPS